MLDHSDDNWPAVRRNVGKARQVLIRLGKILRLEGGVPASVRNVLLGSVTGGITLWGGDLLFVGGDVPESGGSARGIPQKYDGDWNYIRRICTFPPPPYVWSNQDVSSICQNMGLICLVVRNHVRLKGQNTGLIFPNST